MTLILAFLMIPVSAQQVPQVAVATAVPAAYLPKDSPHLYRMFFYFHKNFDAWVQQKKAGKLLAESQRIDQEVASTLRLSSVATLGTLRTVSNSFADELLAVDEQERQHANARARYEVGPEPAQMQAFEAARNRIVDRGTAALRLQLGPADWEKFQEYVNGPHRSSYTIITPKQ